MPGCAQVAPAAPVHLPAALTLHDAIALSYQPQVFAARTYTTAAIGQKQESQVLYYPVFTPTYEYQNTHDAEYDFPASTITIPSSAPPQYTQTTLIPTIHSKSTIGQSPMS